MKSLGTKRTRGLVILATICFVTFTPFNVQAQIPKEQNRHEKLEGRVTDLEARMAKVEAALHSGGMMGMGQKHGGMMGKMGQGMGGAMGSAPQGSTAHPSNQGGGMMPDDNTEMPPMGSGTQQPMGGNQPSGGMGDM